MEEFSPRRSFLGGLLQTIGVLLGTAILTAAVFGLLPLIQAISEKPTVDRDLTDAEVFEEREEEVVEPEEEEPEDVEDEPEPVELDNDPQPLTFDQLELVLGGGSGSGWGGAGIAPTLSNVSAKDEEADDFGFGELDQRPQAMYQAQPDIGKALKKLAPATVWVAFIVDAKGRVQRPKVTSSTNPAFERAALAAVQKWKFSPGKRGGKAASFRMKVPITFPRG